MDKDALTAHLNYFAELGVTGVSKDAAWTHREISRVKKEEAPEPVAAAEAASLEGDTNLVVAGAVTLQAAGAASLQAAGAATLEDVRAEIGDCTRCKLCSTRTNIVFGTGNPNADLMFVGEAPGADEDQQGEPFVGRAGQLLTKIIEAIGMQRSDVFIANVLKCRPPSNRAPEPDEVERCEPFLFKQIDVIKPKVIVALGTHAAHALLKIDTPISRIRGQMLDFRGTTKLMPTFHPAYLLRSPDKKRDVWEDMKKVRAFLSGE